MRTARTERTDSHYAEDDMTSCRALQASHEARGSIRKLRPAHRALSPPFLPCRSSAQQGAARDLGHALGNDMRRSLSVCFPTSYTRTYEMQGRVPCFARLAKHLTRFLRASPYRYFVLGPKHHASNASCKTAQREIYNALPLTVDPDSLSHQTTERPAATHAPCVHDRRSRLKATKAFQR